MELSKMVKAGSQDNTDGSVGLDNKPFERFRCDDMTPSTSRLFHHLSFVSSLTITFGGWCCFGLWRRVCCWCLPSPSLSSFVVWAMRIVIFRSFHSRPHQSTTLQRIRFFISPYFSVDLIGRRDAVTSRMICELRGSESAANNPAAWGAQPRHSSHHLRTTTPQSVLRLRDVQPIPPFRPTSVVVVAVATATVAAADHHSHTFPLEVTEPHNYILYRLYSTPDILHSPQHPGTV